MFGRKHSEETCAKMSDKKTVAILEGRFRPYGTNNKKGTYVSTKTGRSHYFKSSWEETVMKHLDSVPDVSTWDYECLRIPYKYGIEGKQRWYVPDFMVTFQSGVREVWEVKPEQFLNTERVRNTTEAGSQYCEQLGIVYRLLTRRVMQALGILASVSTDTYRHESTCRHTAETYSRSEGRCADQSDLRQRRLLS